MYDLESFQCIHVCVQGTRPNPTIQGDGQAGRIPRSSVLTIVLACEPGVSRPPFPKSNPTFAFGDPGGRHSSAWLTRGVTINVSTWTNCGHARGASCTRESEAAAYMFLGPPMHRDWGELEPTDVAENEYSVAHGFRN